MSKIDANFKVKVYHPTQITWKINLSLRDSWTTFYRLSPPPQPNSFICVCVCTRLCVHVCLFGFVCRYIHVCANANGRAAQPGIKTAIQTDWGSRSESAMSKHNL